MANIHEGYMLVPVEPTEIIIHKLFSELYNLNTRLGREYAHKRYKDFVNYYQSKCSDNE